MNDRSRANVVLAMNTFAFTVCFACWMLNGVLATFLVDNGVFPWNKVQIGWLIGIPVLTGSLVRLPVGMLTDRYGGRLVYTLLMLLSAIPMWLLSGAESYSEFAWASLGFGMSGASFAVGIAYSSIWFAKERQGLALGIFGAGNAGAAVTSLCAPHLLLFLTKGDAGLEGWRTLPKIYAAVLVATALLFWCCTWTRIVEGGQQKTLANQLRPLLEVRVWRFGLYYFFVFGGFVALSQWLIPYYVNVYAASLATAGLLASIFSLPSGVIRALGGWLSDLLGARTTMYWVLAVSLACCALLVVPRMDIHAPGQGIMAPKKGVITEVSAHRIVVDQTPFVLRQRPEQSVGLLNDPEALIWPHLESWQEPAVVSGEVVRRRQLLARGVTHIYFQANLWVFTALVFILGIAMGVGKAAVYKYIPEYFPKDVGVVGGIVGVLGGLGGFFGPILFGHLLERTGIWTTCWMFFLALTLACIVWLHLVVRRIVKTQAPQVAQRMELSQPTVLSPTADAPALGKVAGVWS